MPWLAQPRRPGRLSGWLSATLDLEVMMELVDHLDELGKAICEASGALPEPVRTIVRDLADRIDFVKRELKKVIDKHYTGEELEVDVPDRWASWLVREVIGIVDRVRALVFEGWVRGARAGQLLGLIRFIEDYLILLPYRGV